MADSIVEGRLRRITRSLLRHGPLHIAEVFLHRGRRRRFAASGPRLPEIVELLGSDPSSSLQKLRHRATELITPWKLDHELSDATLGYLEERRRQIVRGADLIASGRFTSLGHSTLEVSGTFNWHRDYVSGKEWPLDRFDRVEFLSGDGADVKSPWELSRCYWIGWLGLAHLLEPALPLPSSGERPAEAFKRLADDWIEKNPYGKGVNWAMPMEVAIRAFWLIVGAALFRDVEELDDDWWGTYFQLLAGHAISLTNTLEYNPLLTNHYVADCFGLVAIGSLCQGITENGETWLNEGSRRLQRELKRQVTSDGYHHERSLPYHGLVLELYLLSDILTERTGSPLSPESRATIDRMAGLTEALLPAHGTEMPLIGDADDGRLLRLSPETALYDQTFLLDIHAAARESPSRVSVHSPESVLLFGAAERSSSTVLKRRSVIFPDAGLVVLRNSSLTCILDVGPIGLHGNNDTLSFTLNSADGTAWVVDPGTGCYTGNPVLRNELRSTAAHNSMVVEDEEIAQFAGLWRVREDTTRPAILEARVEGVSGERGDPLIVRAEHHGYDDLAAGRVRIEREMRLEGEELRVVDRVIAERRAELALHFTLDHDVAARKSDGLWILEQPEDPARGFLTLESEELAASETILSPSYGITLPTTRLGFELERSLPAEFIYIWRFARSPGT